MTRSVLVLNGPNLDRLGDREPQQYGTDTLDQILERMQARATQLGVHLHHVQSNHEGVLIDAVHDAGRQGRLGAVVNAAGYTHSSVALRDALLAVPLPFVEVHLSNVWAREAFRHRSLLSDIAVGVVAGFGPLGYELALMGLLAHANGSPGSGEV
jgi:3-dehydroquinate dehydratase-2